MDDRRSLLPITDDDATIAAMLEDLSVPTLLASLVHLTGDASILRGDLRPAGIYLNEVQGFMSPEDQAAARALALEHIAAFRDGGSVLPPPPTPEVVREIMEFLIAGPIPDAYVPLMLEELGLDGTDARDLGWGERLAPEQKAAFHVVVIGAGMSGLLAGIRLGAAGIPYTIVEKNDGVGGTWYENRYPGCRVDVGNHFYSYSFAPDDHWTEFFAQQPELQAYFEACMRDYGVEDHIRFGTEVTAARWDDDACRWTVETTGGTLEAGALIGAVGQLNRPKLPDIEGQEDFEARRCTRRSGCPARTCAASGWPWSAPGPAPSRSCPRWPPRSSTSPSSSGRRRGCSPTRTTTSPPARAWRGPPATCPATAAGTGSCSCGRAATGATT
ncbi:MAG: NAD(P)/FAD-dependent oxidoreductase [Acidimicrobiales bacterium]